ncbi:unnamed protein product [Durusdinium trenchii]|uniref:Uncharacterized protein n=1 Tax=Durusdinium trenchii TaxID=1381693 RepID=A0ABP0HHF0_9DINO
MHRFFCPFENTQCQGTARQDPSLTQVLSVLCRELHEQLGRRWAPAVSLRLLQQPANNRLCPRAAAFAEARHRASELQRGGATTAGTQTETLAKLYKSWSR